LLLRHAQCCPSEQLGFRVFSSLVLDTKCFFFFVGSAIQILMLILIFVVLVFRYLILFSISI
jgi:hypothetical protein